MTLRKVSLVLLTVIICTSCMQKKVNLSDESIDLVAMPVLKPLPRTLYLVLEEERVPSSLKIENSIVEIDGFREFFGRTLQEGLASYFTGIEVLESPKALPDEAHFVANVVVESLKHQSDTFKSIYELRWSFAVRASEAEEYTFALAGTNTVTARYGAKTNTKNLMSAAMDSLHEKWSEKEVMQALRKFDTSEDPTPREPTTDDPLKPDESDQPQDRAI